MKRVNYKSLRLCGILLCLLLIVGCVAPLTAVANEAEASDGQDSVHFINPTAITVLGDRLYVSDIVEDGKTALLCFDISGSMPLLKYTYDKIDGDTIGLSNDKQNTLFLNMGNKVMELTVTQEGVAQTDKIYSMPVSSQSSIVDVAYGKIANIDDKTLYALTQTGLSRYDEASQTFNVDLVSSLNNTKALLSIDKEPNYQLYYLSQSGSDSALCNRMNLSNGGDTGFASKLTLTSGFVPTGMLQIQDSVALYDNDSIFVIEETANFANTVALLTLSTLYASKCRICDVESYGERLFVLNSENKIDVFDKTEDVYNKNPTATIGSDQVSKDVPTSYTSFTLARPSGYPANIVYKTSAETSIPEIITDASEYVILGYEGDDNSHYYYVMVGDKFGWVKKSDGAENATDDGKLNIVNNNLSDATFTYEARFTSLKAVYVYDLPLSTLGSEHQTEVSQTASSMKAVKLLQKFNEGDTTWYLISYDEGKTGFVKESDVGKPHITSSVEPEEIVGRKKINSSLFAAVNLYLTAELKQGEFVTDAQGNQIKLYSGDEVRLVKTEQNSAFVMILHKNGDKDFGWIEADRLIELHQITTNAIVGLVTLAVAIALAATLLIVYFKRKKRIRANRD